MSRRRKAIKRQVMPDPKFNDKIVSKFTSCLMYDEPGVCRISLM